MGIQAHATSVTRVPLFSRIGWPRASARASWARDAATALAPLLACSVVVDLLFFTGFIASDDVLYTAAARKLAETGRLWPDLAAHEARLFMIGWCALMRRWFREDVQAVAASFVFFHQALNVLTFALARPVQGLGGALLAATLSATFPLLVVFSTTILPDIPMTVGFVASFLVLRAALGGGPGARRLGLFALSGAGLGFTYLAKESGLVPVPFFLAMALFYGRSTLEAGHQVRTAVARAAAFLAGLLLVLGLEALALRAVTGAWCFRLAASFAGGGGGAPSLAALGQRAAVLAAAVAAHAVLAAALVATGLAAALYSRKRPGVGSILLFPAWYAAYYAWGSVSLRAYYAPTLQARYFIPCIPFVLVAVSVVVCLAYGWMARKLPAPRLRILQVVAGGAMASVIALQLAVVDGMAGNVYGAPLVSQALRALRSESPSSSAPIVISEALGAELFPLLGKRPEGLLFSHEVGADQLERWRGRGGFRFMDLHPTSPLHHPQLNPLLGWRHGLPPSGRCVERLVASLLSGEPIDSGWTMRPAESFDRVGPRSAEIRALLGDPYALARLGHRPDRGVLVYRVAAVGDDLVYPLPAFDASATPLVVNGTLEHWSDNGPLGWQVRDAVPVRVPGPEGAVGARIGPGRFSYLWQLLAAPRSARGRTLTLRARVRSDEPGAARLWIKVAVGADWEEVFGDPHPGDGIWRPQEASLPVPAGFAGGEARIVLLHARTRGWSEFANVELSVR